MGIKYDVDKLQNVISDFYNVTGLKVSIRDTAFRVITESIDPQGSFCTLIQAYDNCEGCRKSDLALLEDCRQSRKAQMGVCHMGLPDIALPILRGEIIIGYVILGQARGEISYEELSLLLPAGADAAVFREKYEKLTRYSRAQMESAARMAGMLVLSILSENMIRLEPEELAEAAADYIARNLDGNLSLKNLCSVFGVSKNILYQSFRAVFDCTITEFIMTSRINRAKELLKDKEPSIREVAEQTGVADQAYFCRLFKQKTGVTPLKWREEQD